MDTSRGWDRWLKHSRDPWMMMVFDSGPIAFAILNLSLQSINVFSKTLGITMHIEIAGVLMISWAVMTAVFGLLFYAIDIINRDLLYPRPVISKPRMFLGHLALGAIAPVIIIMFVWRAFRKMQTVNGCREELHEYFRARNSAPATNVIQPLLPTSSS